MATEHRLRALYAQLLRLYPAPFRDRFGEGMRQSFQDLCLEETRTGRRLARLALWVFAETAIGIAKENTANMPPLAKTTLRVAIGALAAWMIPFIASRLISDWNWPTRAFVVVYVLFFTLGMAFTIIARRMGVWSYKAGVGLAMLGGFVLAWSNMVHVADSENPANLIYYSVPVLGFIGATLARLRPQGLSRTLFSMAALLAAITVVLPSGAPPEMARNMAIGHVSLVVLFTASGLLFRHASAVSAN